MFKISLVTSVMMSVPEIGQEAYSMVFKAYKVASRQVTRVASHAYAEDLYVKNSCHTFVMLRALR